MHAQLIEGGTTPQRRGEMDRIVTDELLPALDAEPGFAGCAFAATAVPANVRQARATAAGASAARCPRLWRVVVMVSPSMLRPRPRARWSMAGARPAVRRAR